MIILLFLLLILILIVVATTKFNIHPLFTLIVAAIVMGFIIGLDGNNVLSKITEGFGSTLSSIGLIIAFGTTIGILLEKSGSTRVMADTILKWVGLKRSALAMNLTGLIVSISVFCDSGFVVLSSLNKALSKRSGIPLVVFAVSLATGLYATHVFVPPTPGPLAASAVLGANLGLVMILGIIIAIPVSLTGYFWSRFIGNKIAGVPDKTLEDKSIESIEGAPPHTPPVWAAFAPVVIPIILIALKSIANYPTHPFGISTAFMIIDFIGNPNIALLTGVVFALSLTTRVSKKTRYNWVVTALKEAGIIILITGAGGAFGNVLRASDLSNIIGTDTASLQTGIFMAFLIAAVLKTAQGSSTVAMITTAAIIAPMLNSLGLDTNLGKALAVLAIGSGAMTLSHVNDSYFWVVSRFSDMDVKTALRSHSMATLLQGLTGLVILLLINAIFR